jgi:protein arginine N-methyltransferase 3
MSGLVPADDVSLSGSSEDILDLKDDEGWEDAEPDIEETQFKSLLDDEVFSNIPEMLKHCKEKHNFDFLAIRQKLGLDFYGNIKLINYIRFQVQEGKKLPEDISKSDFEDEKFLKPVLEDDALLFSLDDLPEIEDSGAPAIKSDSIVRPVELVARVSELEEELRRMQTQFDNYRATVSQTLDDRWNTGATEKEEEKRDDDSHYFSSYSYNGPFLTCNFQKYTDSSRYSRDHAKGYCTNRRLSRLHIQ